MSVDPLVFQSLHFDSQQPLVTSSVVSTQPAIEYRVSNSPPETATVARSMLLRANAVAQSELWPVKGADDGVDALVASLDGAPIPLTSDSLTSLPTGGCLSPLDRLVVAALTAALSRATFVHFARFADIGANVAEIAKVELEHTPLPTTTFDFQSATQQPLAFQRDLASFRNYTQQHLIAIFKIILYVLLSRFSGDEPRFDQIVLQFVATSPIDAPFTHADYHASLARRYVYSALYDGQLLRFTGTKTVTAPTELGTVSNATPPTMSTQLGVTAGRQQRKEKNAVKKIFTSIETRTAQVLQQHKLFNQLIEVCKETNRQHISATTMTQTIAQLQTLAGQSTVWPSLLKMSLLTQDAKNRLKASRLCCLALTNVAAHSGTNCLTLLETCGFFDDPALLAAVLDSGCLQLLTNRSARLFLLQKLKTHLTSLLTLDTADDQLVLKRILWVLFVAANPLTRSEQKSMHIEDADVKQDTRHTECAIEIMAAICEWLTAVAATRFDIEKTLNVLQQFLLRHRQYRLALVFAQRRRAEK